MGDLPLLLGADRGHSWIVRLGIEVKGGREMIDEREVRVLCQLMLILMIVFFCCAIVVYELVKLFGG
jgi:hypothetical protein